MYRCVRAQLAVWQCVWLSCDECAGRPTWLWLWRFRSCTAYKRGVRAGRTHRGRVCRCYRAAVPYQINVCGVLGACVSVCMCLRQCWAFVLAAYGSRSVCRGTDIQQCSPRHLYECPCLVPCSRAICRDGPRLKILGCDWICGGDMVFPVMPRGWYLSVVPLCVCIAECVP